MGDSPQRAFEAQQARAEQGGGASSGASGQREAVPREDPGVSGQSYRPGLKIMLFRYIQLSAHREQGLWSAAPRDHVGI